MENTNERLIELRIDPDMMTVNITAEGVNARELIDGYVGCAAAVAELITKNADDVDYHMAIDVIAVKFMQQYLNNDDDDEEDKTNA